MATADAKTKPAGTDATPEQISGGHLVAKALKSEGVDVIFTLCGGHIIDIYDGCLDEGIKIIDVRHEQVAAHAADGYARQTGKPGCAVVTAGPGTTDAVTGIANAFRAESPMLMIGGQGALSQHKMGSLQDLPHVDILSPIHQICRNRAVDRTDCRHGVDGVPRVLQRRAGPIVPRDSTGRARRQGGRAQGASPPSGALSCLDEGGGGS